MASGALFASSNNRSQSKNLVEFRAGKMHLKEGNMVHPDKRKGTVYIYQSDDSLMHFCWKDRTTGVVEDDLIIFPDDIEFKLVTKCTTGRVYVLKFKSSVRRFFFWLQEPKSDKDEDICRKVNDFLNNPPTPGSNRSTGSGGVGSDLAGLGDSDLHNILGNMSQQQLMQLLGGMGMTAPSSLSSLLARPGSAQSTAATELSSRSQTSHGTRAATTTSAATTSTTARPVTASAVLPSQPSETTNSTTTATTTAVTTAAAITTTTTSTTATTMSSSDQPRQHIQLSDLQNILSNMQVPVDQTSDGIELSQVLKPDDIIPILAKPEIQQRLLTYLPEGESLPRTEEELRNTVKSPQFQQALNSFSAALRSRELGPLMAQFGLGEAVATAAAQGDLEAFVKALEEAQKSENDEKDEDTSVN